MRRLFQPDKHWLLLSFLTLTALCAATVARAQGDLPDPNFNQQDAAAAVANDDSHDSHVRIVRISYVDGQVRIDHGSGYESATLNVPVTEHNWLQTRSDGWAEVQLEDGSLIRLAPDTVVVFTELGRLSSGGTVTAIDLDQGEAEFKIAKRDDSDFRVTVKNKTIVVQEPGTFRVTSTNADPLEIVVWKGEVAVRDGASGGEVAVKKNETFVLDAMDVARYALDKGWEADELDQWSRQRDDYLSAYAANHNSFRSPYQYGTGDLSYYGEYFEDPSYGTLWQPNGVNLGWDPFMNGYWFESPGFGYTWVSAYPWGWLPYRYGRWVYLNHRGWCWAPGGWGSWHPGPRWANAPPGFRAPAPPAANRIVISGAPGGRVVRPANSGDRGGAGLRSGGNSGRGPAGAGNDDRGVGRRRVLTNDDVQSRVPRTDVPAQPPAQSVVDMDRRPKQVEQQPSVGGGVRRMDGDRQQPRAPANTRPMEASPLPERTRIVNPTPPPQPVAPPVQQPMRQVAPPAQPAQSAPPVRQYTPPAHQQVPPAAAPMRQSGPPAEGRVRSSDDGGAARSSRPK